jgi:hypothetical protein
MEIPSVGGLDLLPALSTIALFRRPGHDAGQFVTTSAKHLIRVAYL